MGKNYSGKPKWIAGKIMLKQAVLAIYKVTVQGVAQRRHVRRVLSVLKSHHITLTQATVFSYTLLQWQLILNDQ